ncbi:MAG TPA: hypothetical protein VJP77_00650 [Planctomycetota bacterium]|nr:hypothetical protein [Planctomycetota bacterium]
MRALGAGSDPAVPQAPSSWSADVAGPFQSNVSKPIDVSGCPFLDHASYVYYRGNTRSFVELRFQLNGPVVAGTQVEGTLGLEDVNGATIGFASATQPDARLNAALDAALDFTPGTKGSTLTENSLVKLLTGAEADQLALIHITITLL